MKVPLIELEAPLESVLEVPKLRMSDTLCILSFFVTVHCVVAQDHIPQFLRDAPPSTVEDFERRVLNGSDTMTDEELTAEIDTWVEKEADATTRVSMPTFLEQIFVLIPCWCGQHQGIKFSTTSAA